MRGIGRKISFPGERNLPGNQLGIFVPRGTKFASEISREISFPGEQNFTVNQLGMFVPRGTEFLTDIDEKKIEVSVYALWSSV